MLTMRMRFCKPLNIHNQPVKYARSKMQILLFMTIIIQL